MMANCGWNVILFIVLILRLICAYENIALNKPAYQQHPFTGITSSIGNATKAVDGLKLDRSAWGGQCVVSENRKYSATWWVDLTGVSCISHITVYYMTGNKEWGPSNEFTKEFLGFSIYVSNTTEKSEGVLCFKDSEFNKSTIPNFLNITCSFHGRYVIFYNERQQGVSYPNDYSQFAFNGLCEVEVYGLDNCSNLCPDRNCHCCAIGTNMCQGCKPGYEGKHCEIELDEQKDGYKKSCGYCSDLSKCNYKISTCVEERRSDTKRDDNRQEHQFTDTFERQTTGIGITVLVLQIVIILIMMICFLYLRRSKLGKQRQGRELLSISSDQGNSNESSEQPCRKNYKKRKDNSHVNKKRRSKIRLELLSISSDQGESNDETFGTDSGFSHEGE